MRTIMLIALVWWVSAAVPHTSPAPARAAAPFPAPQTALGREIETLLLALRPALVLVPVGMVVAAVRRSRRERRVSTSPPTGACRGCGLTKHAPDAAYCRRCGHRLVPATEASR